MTISTGSTILAADINAIKSDVDAILSASGDNVAASETTTSTSYTDLATSGPAVTVTTGTTALIFITAEIKNSGANDALAAVAVSGASSISASDDQALIVNGTSPVRATVLHFATGLTAGSNTFTVKYKVGGGTGTFVTRRLTVIPIGD